MRHNALLNLLANNHLARLFNNFFNSSSKYFLNYFLTWLTIHYRCLSSQLEMTGVCRRGAFFSFFTNSLTRNLCKIFKLSQYFQSIALSESEEVNFILLLKVFIENNKTQISSNLWLNGKKINLHSYQKIFLLFCNLYWLKKPAKWNRGEFVGTGKIRLMNKFFYVRNLAFLYEWNSSLWKLIDMHFIFTSNVKSHLCCFAF